MPHLNKLSIFVALQTDVRTPVSVKDTKLQLPNVVMDRTPTREEFTAALKVLTTMLYQSNESSMVYDLTDLNHELWPVKEMTLGEIEMKLGHKIKIVGGKNG